MGKVDPTFIQPSQHQPSLRTTSEPNTEIPLINLSISDTEELVSEIGNACKNWGFFQVINHGVPLELLAGVKDVAKTFFHQSMEEKRKVKRDEVNSMGFHDSEHTKNVRDWKEVFDFLLQDPTLIPASDQPDDKELRTLSNQWPKYPPEFRETCQEYAREVEKLAFRLLELVSLSLGFQADKLNGYFIEQISFLRINYYPPCPFPERALGVGPHKDSGALTVLAQDDVDGLQVRRQSDGKWVPVKHVPDAFIINIGDIIQVWSNDAYESVEHRVVANTERERFSLPFFFLPAHHVEVKPLEELVDEHNPPKYKPYIWGKFFAARNRSDYKKRDAENIQIHHFRIRD